MLLIAMRKKNKGKVGIDSTTDVIESSRTTPKNTKNLRKKMTNSNKKIKDLSKISDNNIQLLYKSI